MRSLISTIVLVAAFGVASAQTDKGRWVVGGSANLSDTSTGADGIFNLNIRGGYFLADNFAAGLNLIYIDDNDVFGSRIYGIGPWVRYYYGGFYAGVGYDFESVKFNVDLFDESASGTQLKLEAGYPVFIFGETVALEPSLNYWIGGGDLYEDSANAFGTRVGFFLYF
ncbi:MAG: outer membrane beta-barrel protein [Ekhidna sp.]|nr:outer membrane beta-barrel protein [Ekhidna sp.]